MYKVGGGRKMGSMGGSMGSTPKYGTEHRMANPGKGFTKGGKVSKTGHVDGGKHPHWPLDSGKAMHDTLVHPAHTGPHSPGEIHAHQGTTQGTPNAVHPVMGTKVPQSVTGTGLTGSGNKHNPY